MADGRANGAAKRDDKENSAPDGVEASVTRFPSGHELTGPFRVLSNATFAWAAPLVARGFKHKLSNEARCPARELPTARSYRFSARAPQPHLNTTHTHLRP